jgi:hypothetical protein
MVMESELKPEESTPKKKGKKTLLIVLIVLAVLAIPTCGVVGVFVAIAIPALATAKQDAQNHIAGEIFRSVEYAKQSFAQKEGRSAQTWADILPYIELKGEKATSPQDLMAKVLGGGNIQSKGIEGAEENKITFADGRVISFGEETQTLNFPKQELRDGPPHAPSVSEDSVQVDSGLAKIKEVIVILNVTQGIHALVDWKAFANLEDQSPNQIEELYLVFDKMEDNTQRAVPNLVSLQKDQQRPADSHQSGIIDLCQDATVENIAMCVSAKAYIETYMETGKIDKTMYNYVVSHDHRYAKALESLAEVVGQSH